MAIYFMEYDVPDEEYEIKCILNYADREEALNIAINKCRDQQKKEILMALVYA